LGIDSNIIKSTYLYQLLNPNVEILSKTKKGIYTETQFIKDYGIYPKQWVNYLSLVGTHNGLPEIRGIGEKTALKYIKNSAEWIRVYQENKELINKFTKLIQLPLEYIELPYTVYSCDTRTVFKYLIQDYGIHIEPYMNNALDFLAMEGI
jgi:5'-3' exonuclease